MKNWISNKELKEKLKIGMVLVNHTCDSIEFGFTEHGLKCLEETHKHDEYYLITDIRNDIVILYNLSKKEKLSKYDINDLRGLIFYGSFEITNEVA